jgi:hypothetical protein
MPILTGHSFDRGFHFNSVDYEAYGDPVGFAISSGYSVDGGYSLRTRSWSAERLWWVRDSFQSSKTQPSVSVYVYPRDYFDVPVEGEGLPKIRFRLGVAPITLIEYYLELHWNTVTHTYDLYAGDSGAGVSLLEAGTIEVSQNDWFQVQFWANIDSLGFARVKIDGHLSIDYSGDLNLGLGYADYCYLIGGTGVLVGNDYSCYWDNWVLGYDEYLGDCHVDERLPNADNSVQWSRYGAGTNYEALDETPQDEADYVFTQTDGHTDLIGLEAWNNLTENGIVKDPLAQVSWVWSKAETATGEHLRVGLSSNGVVSDESHPQSRAFERYEHTDLTNPDTGLDWEKATIDASLLRYEAELSA